MSSEKYKAFQLAVDEALQQIEEATLFTIHYEDTNGAEPCSVGIFHTYDRAVAWMFEFANIKCEGCEVWKQDDPGMETINIKHPNGTACDMYVVKLHPAKEFLKEWNI